MTTTTLTTREAVAELVNGVLSGKAMEMFDRFYAEQVSMQENNNEPTVGKAANRAREEKFFGSLEAFHGGSAPVVLVDGDRAMINWV
ncbi:MAG: nuclear transport factor 2 family protein, partial [Gemmatimonadetes bacterium]|nr:nuclear transport factor 2 family protein [Gemmatimonadota bacterium]